ncbi:hypothetical protein LTR16_011979, partial [Cryomyces antarcticus]
CAQAAGILHLRPGSPTAPVCVHRVSPIPVVQLHALPQRRKAGHRGHLDDPLLAGQRHVDVGATDARRDQRARDRRHRPARVGPAAHHHGQPRHDAVHRRRPGHVRRLRARAQQAHVGQRAAEQISHRQFDAPPAAVARGRAGAGHPRHAGHVRRARR